MNEINLLPDYYIIKKIKKPKRIFIISLALVMATLLILVSTTVIGRYQHVRQAAEYFNKIYEESLSPLLEQEQKLREREKDIAEKYNIFLELGSHKTLMSEILLEIARLTPSNIQINSININSDKSIVIMGLAPSDTDIGQFIVSLGTSPNFRDINLDHVSTEASQGNNNLFRFQVTFFLEEKGGM